MSTRRRAATRVTYGVAVLVVLLSTTVPTKAAFDFPQLPAIFGGLPKTSVTSPSVSQLKKSLLESVSGTNNGKDATPEQQMRVLSIVGKLEETAPPTSTLLTDPNEVKAIDGVWYLQYTSPSTIGDENEFPTAWQPNFASEGDSNIETKRFEAKGSVSAVGINVDTSNRVVQQIFDIETSRVTNNVELDFGRVVVSGPFRPSPNVPNRAIVSFEQADISLNAGGGITIPLGWVFGILAVLRGSKDNGWLETTFIDDEMRIGRGNMGTMFVLTRDVSAVTP